MPAHDRAHLRANADDQADGEGRYSCGRVALAGQFGKPDIGERFMGHLIVTRASIHGFLVFDWWHRRSEALQRLSSWQRTGQIRFKEDVLEGIERMPEAFLRLLHGKNFGKQLIKIS